MQNSGALFERSGVLTILISKMKSWTLMLLCVQTLILMRTDHFVEDEQRRVKLSKLVQDKKRMV